MALERIDIASCSDRLQIALHRARYDFVLSKVPTGANVLEIGVGSGALAAELFPRCRDYIGLDLDPVSCVKARERTDNKARIIEGDIRTLPFPDNTFSHIVCLEVLEHLGDFQTGLRNIARCLDRNGSAIISVPYRRKGGKSKINEYHPYEPGEQELFAACLQFFSGVDIYYQYFEESLLMTVARIFHIRRFVGLSGMYADLAAGEPHMVSRLRLNQNPRGMKIGLVLVASRKP